MKLALMQGRLVAPVNNHIQEFPHDDWEKELKLLKGLGLCGVEWLVTNNSFPNNPILSKEFSHDKIVAVCLDILVSDQIYNKDFLDKILYTVLQYNIKNVTIPLLEDSDMSCDDNRRGFIENICKISDQFPDVIFSFEAELDINKLKQIVDKRDVFKVTYDTGNITSYKLDHREFITTFKDKINNVHLKDRTLDGQTVEPPNGDTDFKLIFELLKKNSYSGHFVLQTARSGPEIETISKNLNFFKKLYNV